MADQFDTLLNYLLLVIYFLNVGSVLTWEALVQYEALYFEIYARKLRSYSKHMLETAVFWWLAVLFTVRVKCSDFTNKDATNLVNLIYRFILIGHRSEGVWLRPHIPERLVREEEQLGGKKREKRLLESDCGPQNQRGDEKQRQNPDPTSAWPASPRLRRQNRFPSHRSSSQVCLELFLPQTWSFQAATEHRRFPQGWIKGGSDHQTESVKAPWRSWTAPSPFCTGTGTSASSPRPRRSIPCSTPMWVPSVMIDPSGAGRGW